MSSLLSLILWIGAFQADTGAAITGRVTDVTGGVMADVEVQSINVETGAKSFARTNEEGLYKITNLLPGIYRLVLQKHGFRSVIKPGVELRVQDIVALNFEMRIGSEAETVTEDAGAPLLQAETATVTQIIDRLMIAELPTATHNLHDFVGLSAGAVEVLDQTGGGIGFAVNGQRSESANFLLDGADSNTNPATTRPGQMLPHDSVREYRILTNGFTADYGRNAGFITNLVTKSGTNELHGSLYDAVRNSALAANSFEDNAYGKAKPVFNRHQVGGSLGGPIVSDKAFAFAAFESVLVRSFEARTFSVPTPELVAVSSPVTQAIFGKYALPRNLGYTGSEALVKPFGRDAFILVPFESKVSRLSPVDVGAGPPQNTHLGLVRVDHAVGRTMWTARYAFQHGNQFAPVTQPYSSELDRPVLTRHHNATVGITRSLSDSILSEFRLAFSRLSLERPKTTRNPVLGHGFGDDNIWELGPPIYQFILPSGATRTGGPRNYYQVHQATSWVRRNHHLRFGGQIAHYRDAIADRERFRNSSSLFDVRSVQSFVDGSYATLRLWYDFMDEPLQPDRFEGHFHSTNRDWHLRYNDAAWFVQDTWKLSRRVTLTPGLRWEYFGVQYSAGHERSRDVNFYLGDGDTFDDRFAHGKFLRTSDAPGEYRNHFIRPDRNNFGPRLGFAFDVTGNGTTILRAGGGLFFDSAFGRVPPTVMGLTEFRNVPFTAETIVTGGPFEEPSLRILPFVETVDPDRRTSYASAWNATIDRDLGGVVVLSGSYIGSAGSNLELAVLENGLGSGRHVGRTDERILTNYRYFLTVKSLAQSSYHSLQLKAEGRRIRPLGLQFGASYTWAHSIDNASERGLPMDGNSRSMMFGDGSLQFRLGVVLDPTDMRLNRGNSRFDQRHRFVTHFVWEVPEPRIRLGFLKKLTGGWQLSGILSFQTGLPLELRDQGGREDELGLARPRVTGPLPQVLSEKEMVPDPKRPNRFMYLPMNDTRDPFARCIPNTAPFACVESINDPPDNLLARNYYRRPGTHFQDVALTKRISVHEQMQLQIRAEFYNVLNHANLELMPADAYSVNRYGLLNDFTSMPARYGGPPRHVVLAAKIIF